MKELVIGGKKFTSRFFLGTGKFASGELLKAAIEASGTELVTTALTRVHEDDAAHDDILGVIDRSKVEIMLNTSGARNAEEAVKIGLIGEAAGFKWIKLEIHPDAPLAPIPVLLGKKDQIQPLYPQPCRLLVEKQARSEVSTRLELCESVQAPVEQGQILGRLHVYVGEELRTTIPLTAAESIPRLTPGDIMLRLMERLLMAK